MKKKKKHNSNTESLLFSHSHDYFPKLEEKRILRKHNKRVKYIKVKQRTKTLRLLNSTAIKLDLRL